jgi:hypothetical protein
VDLQTCLNVGGSVGVVIVIVGGVEGGSLPGPPWPGDGSRVSRMMRRMTHLWVAILFLTLSPACDDDGSNGSNDVGTTGDQTPDQVADQTGDQGGPAPGCWTTNTATNFAVESPGDHADCITGCDNDNLAIFNFAHFTNAGWRGEIDGNSHPYAQLPNGPDLDLYGVILPPRTWLTLFAQPTSGSDLNAVLRTHDGHFEMTFNADAPAPGSPVDPVLGSQYARTQVVNPWVTELPFYFVVEHYPNHVNFGSASFQYEGGNHGYIIRYETAEFAPTELGELTGEGTLSGSGEIVCWGDVAYFRFSGSAGRVTVTRTGSSDFTPYAAGMNTTGGQLMWQGRVIDGRSPDTSADGVVQLQPTQFQDGGTGEFIFAVTDANGWGPCAPCGAGQSPGRFTFDVRVESP